MDEEREGGKEAGRQVIGIVVGVVVAAVVGIGEVSGVGEAVHDGVVAGDERFGWWSAWWQGRPCKYIIGA